MINAPTNNSSRKAQREHALSATPSTRGVIVLTVLSVSILLPRVVADEEYLLLAAVTVIGGIVAALLIRHPDWGIRLIIPAALLIPVQIGTGTGTSVNAAIGVIAFLTGLWLVEMFILRRDLSLIMVSPVIWSILLAVVAILAFIAGQISWFQTAGASIFAQIGGVAMYLLAVAAFLLVGHQTNNERTLRIMVWSLTIIAAIYIGDRYLSNVGFAGTLVGRNGTGSMFWVWTMAMALSQILFNRSLVWWQTVFFGLLSVVLFAVSVAFGYSWKSGWVPMVPVVLILFWLRLPRRRLWQLTFLLLISLGPFLFIGRELIRDEAYSWLTRVEAWQIVFRVAQENILLGVGPSNYYFYTPLYSILGWQVSFNSHSQYLDLLAQTGVLGLICYVGFFISLFFFCWRLATQLSEGSFQQAYIFGVMGGIGGTILAGVLGDWIIPFVYNIGWKGFRASVIAWALMGGAIAVYRLNSSNKPDATEDVASAK